MATTTIIQLLLTASAVLCLALGMWILNSVSSRVSEVKEDCRRAHARVDCLETDRTKKWVAKETDCGDEKSKIAELESILKYHRHKADGGII